MIAAAAAGHRGLQSNYYPSAYERALRQARQNRSWWAKIKRHFA